MKRKHNLLLQIIMAYLFVLFTGWSGLAQETSTRNSPSADCPPIPANFSNFPFPQELSPEIPHDVPFACNIWLLKQQPARMQLAKRLHDIFSWQSFIAINWPVKDLGAKPRDFPTTYTDGWSPRWTNWMNSQVIFLSDGSKPYICGAVDYYPQAPEVGMFTQSEQESGHTLRDRNGNIVWYEILLNKIMVENICDKKLYNQNGQIAEKDCHLFDWGNYDKPGPKDEGSIALKLAWKMLEKGDIPARFLTREYDVAINNGKKERKVFGLVGMHIVHSVLSSRKWIWSTFEHIDNYRVEKKDDTCNRQEKPLRASFNFPPKDYPHGRRYHWPGPWKPTKDTIELNQQVQKLLGAKCSVLQYYKLIDTQWSPDPLPEGASVCGLARSDILQGIGPAQLANSVIETYTKQKQQSCLGCHLDAKRAVGCCTETDGQRRVIWGRTGSADFSFQLSEAHWDASSNTDCSEPCGGKKP